MRIAVIGGTRGLGYGLALRFAKAGARVIVGSRQAERAQACAGAITAALGGGTVGGAPNPEAAKDADVVLVTVPFPGQVETYRQIKQSLGQSTTVIDCNVPLASEIGGKATRMLGVWEGSAAQQARSVLGRGTPMASGFHTVMAEALETLDAPLNADVLVCGDAEARSVAREVVSLIEGARFVDCGPLENARIIESLTALLIGINGRYKLDPGAGIRITNLPD